MTRITLRDAAGRQRSFEAAHFIVTIASADGSDLTVIHSPLDAQTAHELLDDAREAVCDEK